MITYFLVDGGGSKTCGRLIRADTGAILFESIGGPGNLSLGAETVWDVIEKLLVDCSIKPDMYVCGLAGSEYCLERQKFLRYAKRKTILVSDRESGLVGAHKGLPGACLTVGTGVVLSWLDFDKQLHHRGGLGFVLGDCGGGAWLGLNAVRELAVSAQSNSLSAQQSDLVSKFQIGPDLPDWVAFANKATPKQFALLATNLVKAHRTNAWAKALFEHGCDLLEDLLQAAPKKLPLALVGGLAPVYRELLNARGLDLVEAKGDALDGLALIACQKDETLCRSWVVHE